MYKTELHYRKALLRYLRKNKKNPFNIKNLNNKVIYEFGYENGTADIILLSKKEVIAIEVKLTNLRKALYQAYRSTVYAHYAYVIVPINKTKNILNYENEFKRRGVGLCSFYRGSMKELIPAKKNQPLIPRLTNLAINYNGSKK